MTLSRARSLLGRPGTLLVFTGAGASAESGVPTFRDAQTGLWSRYEPSELATPQAWARDPETVWAWYRMRERLLARVDPNPAHLAVARAAREREVVVVTQNVDDLHERAGSPVVHHVHGRLGAHRCADCGAPAEVPPPDPDAPDATRLAPPRCGRCGGAVRPGVVWFGESLPERPWASARRAAETAAAMLVVGTSGLVHPAAGLPELAAARGVPVVEVDPGPSGLGGAVDLHVRARAGEAVPTLLG